MDELTSRIVTATGLDPAVAEKAVGLILSFLAKEGPQDEVETLFAAIPNAQQVVATADTASPAPAGGLMGMAGGGGGVMALGSKLMAAGVPMGEMQTLGRELFAYGREKAGEDTMGAITASIPGLSQFV